MTVAPDVEAAVRRILGTDELRVEAATREAIEYDAFLAGRHVTRVSGTARLARGMVAWSFIEKRTEGPSVASAYLYENGWREMEAYRSGLLDELAADVRAPRLLAATREAGGGLTLWIEDLGTTAGGVASHGAIVAAAGHLGRLSGRWLGRVPRHEWLFGGWIERHSQPEAMPGAFELLEEVAADRTIEARLGRTLEEVAALIAAQDEYASALRTLPETLCHHDAVAANVFRRQRPDGVETVLIDWESVGPGPVGADLASLLFASPRRGDFSAGMLANVVEDAFEAYAAGVREGGAWVEPDQLRLGLHGAIALRWALARDVIAILAGRNTARRGSAPHESADQALAQLLALVPVLLDSAAEARRIIGAG